MRRLLPGRLGRSTINKPTRPTMNPNPSIAGSMVTMMCVDVAMAAVMSATMHLVMDAVMAAGIATGMAVVVLMCV